LVSITARDPAIWINKVYTGKPTAALSQHSSQEVKLGISEPESIQFHHILKGECRWAQRAGISTSKLKSISFSRQQRRKISLLWGSVEGDRHITEMYQPREKHLHHWEKRVTRRSKRCL